MIPFRDPSIASEPNFKAPKCTAGDTELKEEIHGLRTELRTEMQTGDASLREEIISLRASQESFRGTVILMLLGVWFTTVAGVGAAIVTQFVLN